MRGHRLVSHYFAGPPVSAHQVHLTNCGKGGRTGGLGEEADLVSVASGVEGDWDRATEDRVLD